MQCSYCGKDLDQKIGRDSWKHLFRLEDDKAEIVMEALDEKNVPGILQEKLKIRKPSLKNEPLVMVMKSGERWRVEADGGNIVVKRTGKERADVFFWDREIARREVAKLPAIVVRDGDGDTLSAICRECMERRDERP